MPVKPSLFKKVDCVELPVPDLEQGIRFYRDSLSLHVIWKTETSAGLGMDECGTELVLQNGAK